jgi:Domain of unknown function (DUF1772)
VISQFIPEPKPSASSPQPSSLVLPEFPFSPYPNTANTSRAVLFSANSCLGGNTVVSFVFLPSLKPITAPLDRVAAFSKSFDTASKLMISYAGIAVAGFGTAAYYAPTQYLRNSMAVSAALALSIAPFSVIALIPTVQKLKQIESSGDTLKAQSEGDGLLEKWGKLSLVRWSIMSVALLNGLKELSEWYEL